MYHPTNTSATIVSMWLATVRRFVFLKDLPVLASARFRVFFNLVVSTSAQKKLAAANHASEKKNLPHVALTQRDKDPFWMFQN